jgi:hypothetical protein
VEIEIAIGPTLSAPAIGRTVIDKLNAYPLHNAPISIYELNRDLADPLPTKTRMFKGRVYAIPSVSAESIVISARADVESDEHVNRLVDRVEFPDCLADDVDRPIPLAVGDVGAGAHRNLHDLSQSGLSTTV